IPDVLTFRHSAKPSPRRNSEGFSADAVAKIEDLQEKTLIFASSNQRNSLHQRRRRKPKPLVPAPDEQLSMTL
ncbi:MAG: hypothetical protein SO010_12155, partial [Candidatus Limiplasma sp.]|nr:hypothetical protein [Candidatus Limiplasma sp.]